MAFKKSPNIIVVVVVVLVFLFLLVVYRFFLNPKQSTSLPSFSSIPRPIPAGKQTFSVSTGKKSGPKIRNGTIDPYDPLSGRTQTISVTVASKSPVLTVKFTMQTDTKSKEVAMQLTSGTVTDGIWEGTWTVDDTYLYTYNAIIEASDGKESNAITLTLR